MKWLKKRLQRWLGIETIANRIPEMDLQIKSILLTLNPDIPEPEGELPGLLPQNAEEVAREKVKKGYVKPE